MEKNTLNSKTKGENIKELKNLYKNLKFLRQSKNLSINELSKISGINEKILNDIEKGKDFDIQCLFKLCCVYHIEPYEIFSYDISKKINAKKT